MKNGKIVIPSDRLTWPHERRVAKILSSFGYTVEFLPERLVKTADILLDGVEFEIKSPITSKMNTFEHNLKRALKQSPNIIIDISRMDGRRMPEHKLQSFLIAKCRQHRQIARLLLITKEKKVIDITSFV